MTRLILASGSESRRQILTAAGVAFDAVVPNVDEASVKASLARDGAEAARVAAVLAERKASVVSRAHTGALVLGCDQVLACGGRLFDKAATLDEARGILCELRGHEHELITAAVLMRAGEILWRHVAHTRLWMRDFSDAFIDAYLVEESGHILSAVGCYRIEGRGAQLFARIEGDIFAIRGLPLIPLLEALRRHGACRHERRSRASSAGRRGIHCRRCCTAIGCEEHRIAGRVGAASHAARGFRPRRRRSAAHGLSRGERDLAAQGSCVRAVAPTLDDDALATGAVNLLVFESGKVRGHNTDVRWFRGQHRTRPSAPRP